MSLLPIAMGLAEVVPGIIGLFKGKDAEQKAATVIGVAKSLTGETDPQSAVDLIKADPNLAFQLQTKILETNIEEQRIYLEDKQNARDMDVKKTQATGKRDFNMYALAWSFIVGFFATTIVMLALAFTNSLPAGIPPEAWLMIGSLNGTLNAGVIAIIQYFFGSSKSSADKTQLIANK